MNDERPSALEFVRGASLRTLEDFELARRNEASQLAKQIRLLVWKMAESIADAELARLWRESRTEYLDGDPAPVAEGTKGKIMLTGTEDDKPDGVGRRRL